MECLTDVWYRRIVGVVLLGLEVLIAWFGLVDDADPGVSDSLPYHVKIYPYRSRCMYLTSLAHNQSPSFSFNAHVETPGMRASHAARIHSVGSSASAGLPGCYAAKGDLLTTGRASP